MSLRQVLLDAWITDDDLAELANALGMSYARTMQRGSKEPCGCDTSHLCEKHDAVSEGYADGVYDTLMALGATKEKPEGNH